MALPSSSSTSCTSGWIYDVFLSFRGEDTRKNFTDHLYTALKRAGIRTFRDDNELERGEEIGPYTLQAIEKSRFSIIVFSRNYASSIWCLDELSHIIKCRKTVGRIVVPVFYDVEPSDVRKQKRSIEEAFAGYEDRFKQNNEKLQRWRSALNEAANLKGVDVRNDADGHESAIIDNIVKDISHKLDRKRLKVAISPVGVDSRAYVVKSLVYHNCIVGIYGIGGIGKTTIAKEVYNQLVSEFDGSSFLAKVTEKSNPKGVVDLQSQVLSDILKGKHEEIYNSDRGLKVIEERMCSIRVLIVLDDVDKLEQINKILGNLHVWLSRGSRIIITTRTKDLLPSIVYRQYQVEELDQLESLRLFSINAFGRWHPMKEYMELSKRAVHYAGGIPLALEVLGSYLSGKNVDVWESKLEKLKKTSDAGIQNVLEISYHSLDDTEKKIFLDIACFFIGKPKDYIIRILSGFGFFPVDGINTLIKKCLVKIGCNNKLEMHDLIRNMGRQIVFKEYPADCGERSRVWDHEEAFDLLLGKKGTKAVEGLSLNLPGSGEIFSTAAFKKMNRLRLLQLDGVKLSGSYKYISKNLRWLCWREFPLESIPSDLYLGNVVALDMCYNSLKHVWEEVKFLGKLKYLNLSHSHKLTETPNFERLRNLEILILKDCPVLVRVHESIGLLTKLVTLNLKDCRNLESLPRSICGLRSLENLDISGCSKLDKLPEELGNIRKSFVVFAANGTTISRVPETGAGLKNLISLCLSECQLKLSPIKGPNLLSFLPVSLRELDLSYCNLSDDMIPIYLQNLPLLDRLYLCGNSFSSLPPTISLLPKLSYLSLNECTRLQSVPELPSSLRVLHARDCTELERINLTNNDRASTLDLEGCHNLVEIVSVFKVQPIGVEFVKRLLETHGLSLEESIPNIRVCMMNNLTRTSMMSTLQGFSEDGIYSIFLPGSVIPSCCHHQSKGDSITFIVPSLQCRKKVLGFIICAVSEWTATCFANFWIRIVIETKMFDWTYYPTVTFLSNDVQEADMMWLSYWRFENMMKDSDNGTDQNWRFKNEMEAGDEVEVSISMGPHIPVKKCGVHILYQHNDQVGSQVNEPTIIPCTSSKHLRRLVPRSPLWSFRFPTVSSDDMWV